MLKRRNDRPSDDAPKGDDATPSPRSSPWRDGLGMFATRSAQILLGLLLIGAAVWGLHYLTLVVIPTVLALILAAAFLPVMNWMRKKGLPSLLSTIIALAAIVIAFGGIGWLITNAVRNQWDSLASQAQKGFNQLVDYASGLPFAPTQEQIDKWMSALGDFVTSSQFGSGAIAGVSAVASFATGAVLMVVILFFFLKDGPLIWNFLLRPFRGTHLARARRIGTKTVTTLGAYIRGTAAVAAVDAIGIGVGIAIVGVPLALPLGVLVFLFAFIPIVGATVAGALAILVALVANGPVSALIVLGIIILVQQLEGNFLQPVLMGRSLKLHALVILIALTIGTAIGGVFGALIAVPLTAVAWGIVQVWDGENLPARWARPKKKELELAEKS